MLKTKIKASQITNLTDARYFAAWDVAWLGFNLDLGTASYIEPSKMKEILEWVEGPTIVGEFGLQSVDTIKEAIEVLGLNAVQVGAFFPTENLGALEGTTIIKELLIDKKSTKTDLLDLLETFKPYTRFFLLDLEKQEITWNDIKNEIFLDVSFFQYLCKNFDILLNINANTENIHEILDTIQPYGLNVTGGEEEAIGVKSFDELDEIFEALEVFETD